MTIRMLLVLMLGSYLVLIAPYSAHALDCAEPGPVTEEMERSSVVIMGKVLSTNRDGLTLFQVQKAWKGLDSSAAPIEIYSNGWDSYVPGQHYLVFGRQHEGKLQTQLCGHSGPWDATRELAMQNTGVQPISINGGTTVIDPSSSAGLNTAAFAIIAGLFVTGVAAILWLVFVYLRKRS